MTDRRYDGMTEERVLSGGVMAAGDHVWRLKDADTDIWIGEVLPELARQVTAARRAGDGIYYCSDSCIWPQVRPLLDACGLEAMAVPAVCFEPGEAHKQIAQVARGWEALAREGADRRGLVLNVGGGVVGDMGGFMAATYKRGIPFIQVPTSLLAMVDASVGGKLAVDVGAVKNMAGLFVRPSAVFIDLRFLRTLPVEEFYSGVAEIVKMQLLFRPDFRPEMTEVLFCPEKLPVEAVVEAVRHKVDVVRIDFKEAGPRRLLNFGHTFGHAFESLRMAKGNPVPHGCAVAWGMVYELYLSVLRRGLDVGLFRRMRDLLTAYYGRPAYDTADVDALGDYLRQDKKTAGGAIRPVVLAAPGAGAYDFTMSYDEALSILQYGDAVYSF